MTVKYAERADVLYITFLETTAACTYAEVEPGIVCRIDEARNQIVGITIMEFARRIKGGKSISIPYLKEGLSAESLLQLGGGDDR
jgi:uncharacterized protein YuzE